MLLLDESVVTLTPIKARNWFAVHCVSTPRVLREGNLNRAIAVWLRGISCLSVHMQDVMRNAYRRPFAQDIASTGMYLKVRRYQNIYLGQYILFLILSASAIPLFMTLSCLYKHIYGIRRHPLSPSESECCFA